MFGSAVYDIEHKYVSKDSVGLAYDDSCVSLSIAYHRDPEHAAFRTASLTFRLLLRTLAEGTVNANISLARLGN